MEKEHLNVNIVGAGVSGLVAALVLEQHGFKPTIIEATSSVGGRVKTDYINNYQLDHGFQVLLTSYPFAKKYLDFDLLELQKILPGALIYNNKKEFVIGDPLREFSFFLSTIFSNLLSIKDKLKVFKLNNTLKKKTISAIFSEKETTTLKYLSNFGFSKKAIDHFFIPFFSGIFLEDKLETSSRMFEFIYKMFGNGYAAIPKSGMQAIPNQLKSKLKQTTFIFNSEVSKVENSKIQLENGEVIKSDYTIIATNPDKILPTKTKASSWKSCHTLYFETTNKKISKPLIGLITDKTSLINNIFYHTSLKSKHKAKNELLSVTVVKEHNLDDKTLLDTVTKELEELCNITDIKFIKDYKIPYALPQNINVVNTNTNIKVDQNIYLAGDYLLNGSLNAAMHSGETVAKNIIQDIHINK
ncbi:FAD-dependent oxidoreductase [Tenacibaculum jejuense]|uniref:Putative oxidoreductase n=1 Tax=Tenacibaculum jejuense TaxID=584609 RepID=A0A238UB03_9FLAO|nr:FAD-dependent oxidoreductase [Tenacibaculum jejuense]SNR16272.1 Putative oxidoreductase [Tenacibaculum jejuense]